MTDRRELILERMRVVLSGVEGVRLAERNHIRPDEELLPAAVIFDGDEIVSEFPDGPNPDRWRDPSAPQFMTMRPEIYIRAAANKANIGASLNALRAEIHKALVNDAELVSAVGAARGRNGRIQLERVQTDLGWGRNMEGEMILYYALTYILNPSEL